MPNSQKFCLEIIEFSKEIEFVYKTLEKQQLFQKEEQLKNSVHDTLRMNLKHYILF